MGAYDLVIEDNKICDVFLKTRNQIIDSYTDGEMSKKEFIIKNFEFLKELNIKPFKIIDSYEKGMYNYQYYNILAKYYNMKVLEEMDKRKEDYFHRDMRNNYYNEKDKVTMDILKLLNFQDIEAYFIEMESDGLDDQIFEIVLLNYEKAVFHSKSFWLLKKLKEKNVFIREKKKSIINEYINERY